MATYNGAKFLRPQVASILEQLEENDELVMVDDCSTDDTDAIISSIEDVRIRFYRNDKNNREIYTFGRAISLASGDLIFLADQDDLWLPGKVTRMIECLDASGAMLATSNFRWIDERDDEIDLTVDGVSGEDSNRYLKNIIDIFYGRTNYYGCAMAFRAELKKIVLPFPYWLESHDHWIPIAANLLRQNIHIDDELFLKRSHGDNATSSISTRPLIARLYSRWIMLRSVLQLAMSVQRISN